MCAANGRASSGIKRGCKHVRSAFNARGSEGFLNDPQRLAIEYQREENRVLRQQLGKRRLRLSDDQIRRLAVKGKVLGCRLLRDVCTIVTPDTICA
jgi:hypothetical protein